jgi:DNA-directed RNA polymerase subunit K/omega
MSKKIASVEKYNIDNCDAVFGGNRFQLILAAGIRGHEIAKTRVIAARNAGSTTAQPKYENLPTVQALLDVEAGTCGVEYLTKVGKQIRQ